MASQLDQLKSMTKVVADTADFSLIDLYQPVDATTNPSLVFQGFKVADFDHLIVDAVEYGRRFSQDPERQVEAATDKVTVNFGAELLKKIPGRVSTEVDAKCSFSVEESVKKARTLISLYEGLGFGRNRVYIKLAATWQGIQAARILEAEGIACNLTLIFSFAQAVACAQAGVSLISPFVGRITDWHKKTYNRDYKPEEDPGVHSVRRVYNYFKKHEYKTIIMGASFRNSGSILQLAGCDNITISPTLLGELAASTAHVPRMLSVEKAKESCNDDKWAELTEEKFLAEHAKDIMAVEKLTEGIQIFDRDTRALQATLLKRMAATA